jgi:sulfur transfer protein SufE
MSFMSGAAGTKQRYKTIVQQLANPEHEGQKLQALMELNEVLSMSTEDQLAGALPLPSLAASMWLASSRKVVGSAQLGSRILCFGKGRNVQLRILLL